MSSQAAHAARAPLIRFRHGICNQISASTATPMAAHKLSISNPTPKPALNAKPPHVVKPLGPNVSVVKYESIKQLPISVRVPLSVEEMATINGGGAYDPPKPDKKKAK